MTTTAENRGTGGAAGARLTLAVACIGFFVTVLDSTAVTVALPTIGTQLGGTLAGLQWVVDAYTLMFAALMLSAGAIADRVGASRAFGLGLGVFTLASAACGLSPDLIALIGARIVQGGAAAVMLPASLSLVRQAFPDAAARARGIAWWAAGGGAAIAAGPVLGGLLTTALGWRAIFFLNIPAGVLGLLGLLKATRSERRPAPLDLPGQITSMLAMAALTFTVIEAGSHSLGPAPQIGLAVFVVFCAAFVVVELHTAHPALPLNLLRGPAVAICAATGFALNFAFYGTVFVLTLFFQGARGADPLMAGLMYLPMTALVMATNLLGGRLTNRYGPWPPMIAGQLIQAGGLFGLLAVGAQSSTTLILLLLVPLGIGGLAVPPMTTALLEAVDVQRSGIAAGVLNAARQLGGAIGVALFGTFIASHTNFITGMHTSVAVGGAVLLFTAMTGAIFLRLPHGRVNKLTSSRPT